MTFKKKQFEKILPILLLIALGIVSRTVWHIGPNVEFVTTATLLASCYLSRKWSLIIPLLIMGITDIMIGNTNIFIFTWSAYLIIGLSSNFFFNKITLNAKQKIASGIVLALLASIIFYLWTNFGVWFLDSWGMYPKTLTGLIDAYVLGIPFFRSQLTGNLIFAFVSFLAVELGHEYLFRFTSRKKTIYY